MVAEFYKDTARIGQRVLQEGGQEALRNAATDRHGQFSKEAFGQGTWRLLWKIRKFAQPHGKGLDALDPKLALDEAVEHARIFLQRNPIEPGAEIREDISRLAEVAANLDPDGLLRAVQHLS